MVIHLIFAPKSVNTQNSQDHDSYVTPSDVLFINNSISDEPFHELSYSPYCVVVEIFDMSPNNLVAIGTVWRVETYFHPIFIICLFFQTSAHHFRCVSRSVFLLPN